MSASETEIIIEHALLNESNMALAAKVGAAYKQLQRRVILRFLERIRDELRSSFGPEWIVKLELDEKSYPSLLARRGSWPEDINFGVRSHNGCLTWVYVYVTKCGATLGNTLMDQELEGSLRTAWGRYHDRQFHFFHPERFRHWGEQETLVDIYRASDALDYVKALLMTTRDAIAPVIDRQI